MTLQEQEKHFNALVEELKGILIKKGDDYSGKDRLSNFKTAGVIAGITPEQNCLSLIATKVARLGNLLSTNKEPNNEPVEDSIKDLINYSILLHMLHYEHKPYYTNKYPEQSLPF